MKNRNTPLSLILAAILFVISIPVMAWAIEGDITGDGTVDWNDVNVLSVNWLDSNCSDANGWCSGADIDESNSVDFFDFALLANNWLQSDNLPPVVDAGIDQTITLPANASLDGTVTDDGLPNPPSAVTTTWTKQSGPGTITFGDANSVDTTASFSTNGTYVLRLTANDSVLSNYDEVTITVNPQAPVWRKVNIHFHASDATRDDGGNTLVEMVAKYRDSGQVAASCVSGHDYIYDVNTLYTTGSYLAINGVETSDYAVGPHVVGFGMNSSLQGNFDSGGGLQGHIDSIIANGGLPIVAHPYWSYNYAGINILPMLQSMTNCTLISVYNHYCMALWNNGNSEAYWDTLLSSGKQIYGIGEEDAHGIGNKCGFTFTMIDSPDLTVAALKTALLAGKSYFYVTYNRWVAGMTISSYTVSGTTAGSTISIATTGGIGTVTIKFIGNNGSTLQTITGSSGSYTITGTENYVRIKVTDSATPVSPAKLPDTIWTNPVFVTP